MLKKYRQNSWKPLRSLKFNSEGIKDEKNKSIMKLVQLLLPLNYNLGKKFPRDPYSK